MAKQSSRSGGDNTPLFAFNKKPATTAITYDEDNDDDLTTPTAAPSRSVDSDDAPLEEEEEQYQASSEEARDLAAPRQTVDVFFRAGTSTTATTNKQNTTNISIAPTFPSHGALARCGQSVVLNGAQGRRSRHHSNVLHLRQCHA